MDTMNIKKILVPLDFSEISEAVIRHALYLAKQLEAELTLLHVVHIPALAEAGTWLDPVISPNIEQDIRRQMVTTSEDQLAGMASRC